MVKEDSFLCSNFISHLPFRPAPYRSSLLEGITSFIDSNSRSVLIIGKCTNANGAATISSIVSIVGRFKIGSILLTPANHTTGILSSCSNRPTCAVRGRVCHRGSFKKSKFKRFSLTPGGSGRALFVISRISLVNVSTKRRRSSATFNAKGLLRSLVSFIHSKIRYGIVLVNSSTRLPPVNLSIDPTLRESCVTTFNNITFTRLAAIIHRRGRSKVLRGTALLQRLRTSVTCNPSIVSVYSLKLRVSNFSSVREVNKKRLVRGVSSTCSLCNRSSAVVLYHSGGETVGCGVNIHSAIRFGRRELIQSSGLVVIGGYCRFLSSIRKVSCVTGNSVTGLIGVSGCRRHCKLRFTRTQVIFPSCSSIRVITGIILSALRSRDTSLACRRSGLLCRKIGTSCRRVATGGGHCRTIHRSGCCGTLRLGCTGTVAYRGSRKNR